MIMIPSRELGDEWATATSQNAAERRSTALYRHLWPALSCVSAGKPRVGATLTR
jgi:hypothetical protein